jgi:hypothetical protein
MVEPAPGGGADTGDVRIWRPRVASGTFLGICAGLSLTGAALFLRRAIPACGGTCTGVAVTTRWVEGAAGMALVVVGVELVSALFTMIRLTDRELTVRNLFWRTRTVEVGEIEAVTPGYWGLTMRLRNGDTLAAVAAQTSNWRMWFDRPGRGGAIADEIVRRAELVRARGAAGGVSA